METELWNDINLPWRRHEKCFYSKKKCLSKRYFSFFFSFHTLSSCVSLSLFLFHWLCLWLVFLSNEFFSMANTRIIRPWITTLILSSFLIQCPCLYELMLDKSFSYRSECNTNASHQQQTVNSIKRHLSSSPSANQQKLSIFVHWKFGLCQSVRITNNSLIKYPVLSR